MAIEHIVLVEWNDGSRGRRRRRSAPGLLKVPGPRVKNLTVVDFGE
jgi:hypothetical protein